MESVWDIVEKVILLTIGIVLLVQLILHFVRPVTWKDGEGAVLDEDGGIGGPPLPSASFWANLLNFFMPWRR